MSAQVVFRVDGGIDIGAGHMQRCRALARALTSYGAHCLFASTPESRDLLPKDEYPPPAWADVRLDDDAQAVGHSVNCLADWLVVDHYGLNVEFEHSARSWAKHIMVIDDVLRPHDCDLLLDQNQTNEEPWRALIPPNADVLAGPRYVLLRREINDILSRRDTFELRAVLVFGAADSFSITEKLLPAVKEALPSPWALDVIAGPANVRSAALREVCDGQGIVFHHAPRDIATIFARSTIAITAGGSTCWEFAALGVPMIIVVDSDNQENVAAAIVDAGAGILAGPNATGVTKRVGEITWALATDGQRRRQMSEAGRALVDGQGPRRVAAAMLTKHAKKF